MKRFILTGLLLLVSVLTPVNAAEITTCVLDTSIKTNPRVYFFPVTSSLMRCDHVKSQTAVTLGELYEANWRLLQVINPVEFKQQDNKTGYTPVLLYLERTKRPVNLEISKSITKQPETVADESSDASAKTGEKSGGLFNWFKKGDSQQETDDE